jgi:hypothetical protein
LHWYTKREGKERQRSGRDRRLHEAARTAPRIVSILLSHVRREVRLGAHSPDGREAPRHGAASQYRARRWCWRQDHGIFFRCQTAPLKYSYMLGGMLSSCASAMCLRTVSDYKKRSPQMRQCHCWRAKMYGRHLGSFGSSLEWGIFKSSKELEPLFTGSRVT